MIKFDTNMKIVETLPLFYKIEPKKLSSPIRACSSIDGEFIWVYGMGGGDLFVACIRKKGVWVSNSDNPEGLKVIDCTKDRIKQGQDSHYAWVTENGNLCITNQMNRWAHGMDEDDINKPDFKVYQISPNYHKIEGEYILTDHRDTKKIIGRFEFIGRNNQTGNLRRRQMRGKNRGSPALHFENVWECPDEMDYVVEYPDRKIESDES
tara:strand:+ start:283 stop:906 length:624 start_codon:yes stop_codon:yes gene_type:complete